MKLAVCIMRKTDAITVGFMYRDNNDLNKKIRALNNKGIESITEILCVDRIPTVCDAIVIC